jgi:hypothetical protein
MRTTSWGRRWFVLLSLSFRMMAPCLSPSLPQEQSKGELQLRNEEIAALQDRVQQLETENTSLPKVPCSLFACC